MDFYVMAKSYDKYGGHTTLSPIGDFLLLDAPNFGDAIKEITVNLHFPDSGLPKRTLERIYAEHERHRSTLPKIVYRRTSARIEINVASEIMDGRDWKPSPRLSLPLFARGVDEVIQALSLIKKRLKASDSFDPAGFLTHCEASRARIPATEDELQILAAELKTARKAKFAAKSPWEKLGIDWKDFHPAAREILDDPFFWNCVDDFSPNGNDTGSDVLADYRDWLKRHKDGQPIKFLHHLAKRWGYPSVEIMDDELGGEAIIGLAYADIKLRGICDEKVRELAINSIDRQRRQAESAAGWSHREERLNTLAKIEMKLQQTGNKEFSQ